MKKKGPPVSVSPSEWEILSIVWKDEPMSTSEVIAALPDHLEWHPKTVGTFLSRLVDKNVLTVSRRGKENVYTSGYSRDDLVSEESDTFLHRVFRGAAKPLLMHFAERADLTSEDIAELKALLDQRQQDDAGQEEH